MVFFWFLSGLDLYCGTVVEMMKITWAPRRLRSTSAHLRGINRRQRNTTAQPEFTVASHSSQRQFRANRKDSLLERMWLVRAIDESIRESPSLLCPVAWHSEPPIFSPSL